MKQPETRVKEAFFRELKRLGETWFEKIQQVGKRGTPDVVGCVKCRTCGDGKFFAGEIKKDAGSRPDALQWHKMRKIFEAGGLTFVVHRENVDSTVNEIDSLREPKLRKKSLRGQSVNARHKKRD